MNIVNLYFVVTFIISWSGVFVISMYTGIPASVSDFSRIGPIAFLPFLLGPTITSFGIIWWKEGVSGLKILKNIIAKVRLSYLWYIFSIVLIPITCIFSLYILSFFSHDFTPKILIDEDKSTLVITGLLSGLIGGGILEELGWTCFAARFLLPKYGIFKSGFLIGSIWGLWHFLPVFWGCGDDKGRLSLPQFLPGLFFHYFGLIPYRILLVWAFSRTYSFVIPMLMHTSLTCCLFFLFNIHATGLSLFYYYTTVSIILWIIVASLRSSKSSSKTG